MKDPAKAAEKITRKAARAVEKAKAKDAKYQAAKDAQHGKDKDKDKDKELRAPSPLPCLRWRPQENAGLRPVQRVRHRLGKPAEEVRHWHEMLPVQPADCAAPDSAGQCARYRVLAASQRGQDRATATAGQGRPVSAQETALTRK